MRIGSKLRVYRVSLVVIRVRHRAPGRRSTVRIRGGVDIGLVRLLWVVLRILIRI